MEYLSMNTTDEPLVLQDLPASSTERRDAIIAVLMIVFGVVLLASIDFVELLFTKTRDFEHLELDELIAAIPAALLATAWFAYRRWREAHALNIHLQLMVQKLNAAINQRQAAERELHEVQKMAAVGHLAGGLAHEINNVLQPILTLSELTAEQSELTAEVRTRIEKIQLAANRGRDITRKVLTFAGASDEETETVVFSEALQECVDLLDETLLSSVDIHTEISADRGLASINRTELAQMITNLVSNAAAAMDNKGRITIRSEIADVNPDLNAVGKLAAGSYFRVSVTDTGPGMTEDIRTRAFDPFFSTKKPGIGTGLGLSVVFGIIESWGGHISLNSQPENGTTVLFHVPVQDSP
jgi:signal transduction histidine kinase